MSKKIKLAIVGATGLVGRTILKVLEEKNLSNFEYTLFCSKKSAGNKLRFLNREYVLEELDDNSFDAGFNYAIFSAGATVAHHFAPIAASKGCIVIDNSSAFRMSEDVPLVVPEVNPEDIYLNNGIIANPNCSTIQAVVALKPLDDNYSIKRIVYSTYQAVSGAGKQGLIDLENGQKDILPQKFIHSIYNNCIPHIDSFIDNGYTKEEIKMINETQKILHNPNLKITATAVRVPIQNSHSESINIEFNKPFDIAEVNKILSSFPGITVLDNPEENIYPIPTLATGQDKVLVGRIRRDFSIENGLNIWVVADNLRKGAASNAIQILEKMILKKY